MRVLFLDLETSPNLAHVWGLWDQRVGLNQLVKSTEVICYGAQWRGEKKVHFQSVHHDGKEEMLKGIHALVDEADVVVGWNSKSFDEKHLKREWFQAKMLPPSPYKSLDLMQASKGQFRFPSNKLQYISELMGLGGKVQHSGFDLWLKCMAGDDKAWREMKRYQIQDVRLLDDLYELMLPWIPNHPSVPLHDGTFDGCPNCGSEKYQRRGYSHAGNGRYARFQCTSCGKWFRGKSLIAASEHRHAT